MNTTKNHNDVLIVVSSVAVTLIFTPLNFDALIIPKVILAFCTALYLTPYLFRFLYSGYFDLRIKKFLIVIFFGTVVHLLIIFATSGAPFDQQLWGRTGRGFGLIVYLTFLVFLFTCIRAFTLQNLTLIVKGVGIASLISGVYAILQRHSLDIFAWDSKTNGIIGTLGNPNFQSTFSAAGFIAMLSMTAKYRPKFIFPSISLLFSIYLIYICQSTQGYIGILAASYVFVGTWLWFKNRYVLGASLVLVLLSAITAILGMLGNGPLAYYLYKISVQSRGDFFRSAFTTANEHPFFGVGLDSFGDYYLKYRDSIAASHSFAELTDNAHNYFLEFAAVGGYPFAILYLLLIILSLFCFLKIIKKSEKFNKDLSVLFSIWTVFQLQSLISPGNISIMLWNFVICGAVIGIYLKAYCINPAYKFSTDANNYSLIGVLLITLGLIFSFPYFNQDRLFRIGLDKRDGNYLIENVNSYPRFVNKYRMVGTAFLDSNLPEPALMIGKEAVKFNPNAISGWALIFFNPISSKSEKDEAKLQIQRLDPWNKEVLVFKY